MITTIAGTGQKGYGGDGGPATKAELYDPIRVVAAPDGGILIADEGNNVVREIRVDGSIATVAGIAGVGAFSGDGGPATQARLNEPTGVSPLPGGGYLIADRSNNRIRQVSASGIITTVAGSGTTCANPAGACGDGGPATAAKLNAPDRAAPLPDGGFLITEDQGNKVRMVSASGVITRVAGTGLACAAPTSACGDGDAATAAHLNAPNDVAIIAGGGFVISDFNDNRIRMVSAGGTISTIAGNGIAGQLRRRCGRDHGGFLDSPSSVAVTPNGAIVIADTFSHLVRVVSGWIHPHALGEPPTRMPGLDLPCGRRVGQGGEAQRPFDASATPDGKALIAIISTSGSGSSTVARGLADLARTGPPGGQRGRRPAQLRGVNRAVFESRCTYDSTGVADGPVDQASGAHRPWKPDIVRVALNEDCWLGINGLPLGGNATGYRAAAIAYVQPLRRNGLYVALMPAFSAPGLNRSTKIDYMPDNDHLPAFWRSVAAAFASDHGIIFDAINEVAMASWNNPQPNPPASGIAG